MARSIRIGGYPCPDPNLGGKLPSRVFDSPRRREKVKPVDARGGKKEGEFKQACLIDVSVFFPLRAVL